MRIHGVIPENILKLMNPQDRPKGIAGMTRAEVEGRSEVLNEKQLQESILDYLRLHEIIVARQRMDKKSNVIEGYPDITFVSRGIPYAWECKVGKNQLSEVQEIVLTQMKKNGWHVSVVRTLQEAIKIFNQPVE